MSSTTTNFMKIFVFCSIFLTLMASTAFAGGGCSNKHSVSVSPSTVNAGSYNQLTFTIGNVVSHPCSSHKIKEIRIYKSSGGFTINPSTIICPSGWTKHASSSSTMARCVANLPANYISRGSSKQVKFFATAPSSTGWKKFDIETKWNIGGNDQSPDAYVKVVTPPNKFNTSITPTSTPEKVYNYFTVSITNQGPAKIKKLKVDPDYGSSWGSPSNVACPTGWSPSTPGNDAVCTATGSSNYLNPGASMSITFRSKAPNIVTCQNKNWDVEPDFVSGNDPEIELPVYVCAYIDLYVTAPPDLTITNTTPINFTFSSNDSDTYTGHVHCALFIDGANVTDFIGTSAKLYINGVLKPNPRFMSEYILDGSAATYEYTPSEGVHTWYIYCQNYVQPGSSNKPKVNVTSAARTLTVDTIAPTLTFVHIESDNQNQSLAIPGDTVEVSFVSSEQITTPLGTIAGNLVAFTGNGTHFTATYVMQTSDAEGLVPFSIFGYQDLAGNAGSPYNDSTDGSYVLFDKTLPVLTILHIQSDNGFPFVAKAGDTITLTFNASEPLNTSNMSVTIGGHVASVTGSGMGPYTATVSISVESQFLVLFGIEGYTDIAGNLGAPIVDSNASDGSYVYYDAISPAITIDSPAPSAYNIVNIALDYSVVETGIGLNSCWYTLDGSIPIPLPGCANTTLTSLSEGPHILMVYANDTAGNEGNSSVSFLVDLTAPTVNIDNPVHNAMYGVSLLPVDYTVSDNYFLDTCWYYANGVPIGILANCTNTTHTYTPDGTHNTTVYANDTATNVGYDSVQFLVDTTPPVVVLNSPPDNSHTTNTIPIFNWTVTDLTPVTCTFVIDAAINYTISFPGGNHTALTIASFPLAEGVHTWYVTCTDALGYNGTSDTWTLIVDITKPVITRYTPPNNNITNQSSPTFSWKVVDNLSPTLYCDLKIDGSWDQLNLSMANDTIFTTTPTTPLADGLHKWKLRCRDMAGNQRGTGNWKFTIDTVPPVIIVQSPVDGIYNESNISLNYTVYDNGTGINGCWYVFTEPNATILPFCTNQSFMNLSDGNYTLRVCTQDMAVNNVCAPDINFIIDTTPPVIDVQIPQNITYTNPDVPLNYTVYDTGSGVNGCWYVFTEPNATILPFCTNQSFMNLSDGNYTLRVCAQDKAVNNVCAPDINFTVDTVIHPFACPCGTAGAADPYADCTMESNQGNKKNGAPVAPARSDPDAALGPNESSGQPFDVPNPPETTFFSLGFGGDATYCFNNYIMNGPGDDLRVYETTYGPGTSYPSEDVMVEASQDGVSWTLLSSSVSRDWDVDLGSLPWAHFVRVTDVTNSSPHSGGADAYDLDALEALNSAENLTTTLTVIKVVVNDNSGTATVSDFQLMVDSTNVTSGVPVELVPDTYVVSEVQLSGYSASFSGDCDANGTIVLVEGDNSTCTITNDDTVNKTCIDFESLTAGSSVEGLGTVDPNINIYSTDATAVVVSQGTNPSAYTAPNYGPIKNACLGNPGQYIADGNVSVAGKAFADPDSDSSMGYVFTFSPGVTMSHFSLDMSDFGDWNPSHTDFHEVKMTAYDAANSTVNQTVLSFNSTTATMPRSSPQYGDLYYTGDACNAATGNTEPGNWNLEVNGPGIVRVELEYTYGLDPNNALDNLCYVPEEPAPVCDPQVELIMNGGFETPEVSGSWDIFNDSTPGLEWSVVWMANNSTTYNNVTIPQIASLEIQEGATGPASEGDQYAELDGDWDGPSGSLTNEPGSVKISQAISTIPGEQYTLGFDFSARRSTAAAHNILEVRINGVVVDTITRAGSGTTNWSGHTYTFTANSSTTVVEFSDLGTPNSLGTLLDAVSLRCILPQEEATLTVIKEVINDNGGTANASAFQLMVNRSGNSTNITSGVAISLAPGNYTVSEVQLAGYSAMFGCGCGSGGNIVLAPGENRTCIIVNYDQPATLTVYKHVINDNDGTANASDFTMLVNGTNVSNSSFAGDENGTVVTLSAGAYSVDETSPSGYTKTIGAGCNGTASIGGAYYCNITNDDIAPEPLQTSSSGSYGSNSGGGELPCQGWTCGDWSECPEGGIQTRECTYRGACSQDDKPETERSCVYVPSAEFANNTTNETAPQATSLTPSSSTTEETSLQIPEPQPGGEETSALSAALFGIDIFEWPWNFLCPIAALILLLILFALWKKRKKKGKKGL